MANNRYDLAVIGTGPGGYEAAIRASQLKMRVCAIERDRPGGVCLNWGCIPSKSLLNSAETMELIRGAGKEHGIQTGEVSFDFKRVIQRSREAADKLSRGVRFLFRKNNIDLFEASAAFAGPQTLTLSRSDGKPPAAPTIEAERILIATGSRERLFPGMTIGDGMLTSHEALVYDQLPQSVAVIGAGAVGLEFAYFYQAFGAKVTVIELEKQMLPGNDAEVAEELRRAFIKRKVEVLLGHGYKSAARRGDRWIVTLDSGGQSKTVEAEMVLVAVGRLPNSEGLGLDRIGVEVERGFIKIDDSFRTTRENIYAIGDVIGPPLLAHKASGEGIAAVEIMAGEREPGFDLMNIPACVYCEPEVATIGMTEAAAKAAGIEVKVGKFPFRANGKAVAVNHVEGFVKLVAGKKYGEVLGCQIIGHGATDMIAEVALGKTLEATTLEFGRTSHPHPTISEAIMEAALAADGEAINF
ncbi:MAG: dihydrolipoyl dehydrogenase [Candidatus Binataceae bacterium]